MSAFGLETTRHQSNDAEQYKNLYFELSHVLKYMEDTRSLAAKQVMLKHLKALLLKRDK